MVLFQIKKHHVRLYEADCKLWAREARKASGFKTQYTLYRTNEKDQYASFYLWRRKTDHLHFMKKNHERLVALSKCPVKVLGYFNFETKNTKFTPPRTAFDRHFK